MAGLRRAGLQHELGGARVTPRASASDSMLRKVASKAEAEVEEERPPRSLNRREAPRREARGGESLMSVGWCRVAALPQHLDHRCKAAGGASPRMKTLSEEATWLKVSTSLPLAQSDYLQLADFLPLVCREQPGAEG